MAVLAIDPPINDHYGRSDPTAIEFQIAPSQSLFPEERREEPDKQGPQILAAPWDNFETIDGSEVNSDLQENLHPLWQDAPDPVRFSDFWAANKKIHPQAHMIRVLNNRLDGEENGPDAGRFQVGKLLGYLYAPMYAGGQLPSAVRTNIREAVPTTFGSMYEMRGQSIGEGITSARGFDLGTLDGYPY